jgi:hypothetical protein
MKTATEKQVKAICYHLWRYNAEYIEGANKWLKENLPFEDASQIIGIMQNGDFDDGHKILHELNNELFPL